MHGGPHTPRDTLGFVLAIVGASLWALFPASVLLRDNGVGPELGFPIVMAAGALLGSWAGTSLWRHVPRAAPIVAAGIVAAAVIGVRQAMRGASGIETLHLTCMASAVGGAVVGSRLGWRTRTPERALVCACIAISGPAILMLAIAVASILGYEGDGPWLVWAVILSVIPAAMIATRLCGAPPPERFAAWMFGLLALALSVSLHRDPAYGLAEGALFGAILAGILTLFATMPVLRHHRRQPAREDLPSAQVVDR